MRDGGDLPVPCLSCFCSDGLMDMTTARLRPQTAIPAHDLVGFHDSDAGTDGSEPPLFVLFHALASDQEPRTTTAFATEVEARASFARVRSAPSSMSEWVELVRTGPGRPSVLAWFGRPSTHTADQLVTWLGRACPGGPER